MKYKCKVCGEKFDRTGKTNYMCVRCRNEKNVLVGLRRKGKKHKTILQRMIEELEETK